MAKTRGPIVLTIIDGLGLNANIEGNAWKQATTPILDDLLTHYPNVALSAAGTAVGLPEGQMGNSEVGHLNIGAGEVVYTGLSLIAKSLADDTFKTNAAFLKSFEHVKTNKSRLHVIGLLSPGGVHSLEAHLFAILAAAHEAKVAHVSVHVFGDGRDVAPQSILPSLEHLMALLKTYHYDLASIQGRAFAMDRDENFSKTEAAYEALQGQAAVKFDDAIAYVNACYEAKETDEFLPPAVAQTKEAIFLKDNDAVIFFNFRPDRARQLAHLIVGSDVFKFQPKHVLKNVQLTAMMNYEGIKAVDVAFDSMAVPNPLGAVLAAHNLKQLRLAETQKYAHVTFFMDGGRDITYPGEERILIPSLKLDNFADAPAMSAVAITDALLPVLDQFDVVIMNFANPDMVGHTGNLNAAIKAIETVDHELGRIKAAVDRLDGTMFITADHGNAEIMLDENGDPSTKHTTSDVFFICTDKKMRLVPGALANVAPTILWYMGISIPKNMSAAPLIDA